MIDRIRHNAALVQSVARDQLNIEVDFDRAAVEWLDGYINRQHEQGDPSNIDGLVSTLGSFFGECMVRTYGGAWAQDDHGWCVRFDAENAAFPFSKVKKHLLNGPDDSVLSMFDAIPVIFQQTGG